MDITSIRAELGRRVPASAPVLERLSDDVVRFALETLRELDGRERSLEGYKLFLRHHQGYDQDWYDTKDELDGVRERMRALEEAIPGFTAGLAPWQRAFDEWRRERMPSA